MNPAFKQIGNAVPPLFAYAIARAMQENLGAPPALDMRAELQRSRDRLANGLSELGFSVLPSSGTYFLNVDLDGQGINKHHEFYFHVGWCHAPGGAWRVF